MFLDDIYKIKVEPRLGLVRKIYADGHSAREIERQLDVTQYEWKMIKKKYPDVIRIIEETQGEKSDYHTKVFPRLEDIEGFIYEGLNQKEIANRLNVSTSTIKNYRDIYPEFNDFWLECHDIANNRVVGSAYKRAIGYNYEEKKEMIEEGEQMFDKEGEPIYIKDQEGNYVLKNGKKVPKRKPGKVKVEKITKHMAPDGNMISFWLTNREPKNWSTKRDNNEQFDPVEAAQIIRETMKSMDSTIPAVIDEGPYSGIISDIPKLDKSQLRELSEIINGFIDSKIE